MNITNYEQRYQILQTLLGSSAAINSSDKVFRLLELALTGHMTVEQQEKFLADAEGRMLITDTGIVRESFEDHLVLALMRDFPKARVDVRSSTSESLTIGGIIHLYGEYSIRTSYETMDDESMLRITLNKGGIDDVVTTLGWVHAGVKAHFPQAIKGAIYRIKEVVA